MKEKEGIVNYPEQQVILYVEKEDGKFGPIQTGSFISANYLDDYFYKRRNLELSLRKRVIDGEISPVYYYMVLEDLSISELSLRVRLSKQRVEKHLEPKHFGKCSVEELRKYARVFNVPVANLLQIVLIQIDDHFESLFLLENKTINISIEQTSTLNPFLSVIKIKEHGK